MSNTLKLKKRALELEQKQQLDRAIELYIQLLDEAGRELEDADVPLFNRVGDLLIRQGNVSDALSYYERAVDFYAERGYLNNAIALCNKILRQSPGRTAVYYKLGRISASKGFRSDARKNFLEYADRVQKTGNLDEAFRALKEFATLYPDEDDIRLILAEQLSKDNRKSEALEQLHALYEKLESEGREAEARATLDRMKAIDPSVPAPAPATAAPRTSRSNDLVFLDLSADERPRVRPDGSVSPSNTQLVRSSVPALDGLRVMFVPDSNTPGAVPTIALVEGLQPTAPIEAPAARDRPFVPVGETDGLEHTGDFGVVGDVVPRGADAASEPGASRDVLSDVGPREGIVEARPTKIDPIEPSSISGDQPPLSGMEFAELDLAEVHRPTEPRSHDLALPTELPLLTRDSGTGKRQGAAEESSANAAEVEYEADEVAAASSGVIPNPIGSEFLRTIARNPFDLDVEGFEDDLPAASDSNGEPEHRKLFRHVPDEVVGHHGVDKRSESAEESGVAFDDLMRFAPTFGGERTGEGPAFSPIPGLSEEGPGSVADPEDAEPHAGPNVVAPSGDGKARPQPNESVTSERMIEGSTPVELSSISPQEVEIADGRVESPLPPGFVNVEHNGDPEATPDAAGLHERSAPPDVRGFAVDPHAAGAPGRDSLTLRATVSIGSAEAHLRQRLELEPENWALRRQLGEALLDSGSRDEGLYELDVAMAGFELSGDLTSAQEIADEAIRVFPASVRHHQKRVEYAVRAKDRGRLIEAYLELADALFRTGQADKSVAVYARVLELSSENERALFALATLAPDHLERVRGAPPRAGRWTDELDAIPKGGTFTNHAAQVMESEPSSGAAVAEPGCAQDLATSVVPASAATSDKGSLGETASSAIGDIRGIEPLVASGSQPVKTPLGQRTIEPPSDTRDADTRLEPVSEEVAPAPLEPEVSRPPTTREDSPQSWPEPAVQQPPPLARRPTPVATRRRSATATNGSDAGFVDLGEWLRQDEPEKSTRMVVDDAKPTGDERADFEDLLRRFKRGVAENVEAEDFEAHYDLGVAFKEMGLIDEAIAEFQKALRGSENRVRAYEALGQCFVEKEQYPIAAALMQRAIETPGSDDQQLVGVLYLLGFAHERTGRHAEALRYYQRVFAIDLEFRDISQRVSAMEQFTK